MCEVLKNDNLSNICLGKEFIKHHNDRGNEKSRNCLDSFKCVDISVNENQLEMFDRELIEMCKVQLGKCIDLLNISAFAAEYA